MKTYCAPEVKHGTGPTAGEIHTHPAFGVVTMTMTQGGSNTLFGSDISHMSRIRIEVRTAEMHRHLSNDWIHGGKRLIEFELSHAQFASFITSQGRGDGTPCTLMHFNGEMLPGIERIETKQETFRKEIREAAAKRTKAIREQLDKLGEMIESGKMPKTELRALHRSLLNAAAGLGEEMAFVAEQAEEAVSDLVHDAKVEVDAFIEGQVRRLGVESLSQMAAMTVSLPNEKAATPSLSNEAGQGAEGQQT